MKGTELFAELLMSIHNNGPINKKAALDRSIGNDSINGNTLNRLKREFVATMNSVRRMFPGIHQTRFRNSAEFYSLFLLVWEMSQDGLVLNDRKRCDIAMALLRKLSIGVDRLNDKLRKAEPGARVDRVYQSYLLSVKGDTDSAATRQRRREVLKNLIYSVFGSKDGRRLFTAEQRRIIWGSDEKRVCSICKRPLTSWDDFAVDHVLAHSRGGRTELRNGSAAHRSCNSRKRDRP